MGKKEEYEILLKNPHEYIRTWADDLLMHVGGKAFNILALIPPSLILPPIRGADFNRTTVNLLLIAPPGSGKSTICKKFKDFTYSPLHRKAISAADLSQKAAEMKLFTLIIEDFSQTSDDYDTIKVIEGIIGDEQQINKSNMRAEFIENVRGAGLLCGTPTDLDKYMRSIESGLLSRCLLLYTSLSSKQHSDIGDYINSRIGNDNFSQLMVDREKAIAFHYAELYKIQEGADKEIKPIVSYKIGPMFKSKVGTYWKKVSEELIADIGDHYWIRDLQDFYRLLVASAFLNVHNRNHQDGILEPNQDDFNVAFGIMKGNIRLKWALIKSSEYNRKIRNVDALKAVLDSGVSDSVKAILKNISPYAKMSK